MRAWWVVLKAPRQSRFMLLPKRKRLGGGMSSHCERGLCRRREARLGWWLSSLDEHHCTPHVIISHIIVASSSISNPEYDSATHPSVKVCIKLSDPSQPSVDKQNSQAAVLHHICPLLKTLYPTPTPTSAKITHPFPYRAAKSPQMCFHHPHSQVFSRGVERAGVAALSP